LAAEINLRKSYLPKLVETLKYKDLKQNLESLGCADFWQKICSNKIEKRKILDVFKKNFYSKALDKIAQKMMVVSTPAGWKVDLEYSFPQKTK
jgi:hypothetical protein